MRKVYLYSLLLASGLIASQFLAGRGQMLIKLLMMFCLSFIMIRVGYGFEISKERAPNYIWDHGGDDHHDISLAFLRRIFRVCDGSGGTTVVTGHVVGSAARRAVCRSNFGGRFVPDAGGSRAHQGTWLYKKACQDPGDYL